MKLELTKDSWWQEIGNQSELSPQTVSQLRSAVSSYLMDLEGNSTIPPVVYQGDLDRIAQEVTTLVIDGAEVNVFGDPMETVEDRQESFRLRFHEATNSES